jgi:alpha-L-fucosidase
MLMRDEHAWFGQARFGIFIHWGPYAALGRGEQVLVRERMDQREYQRLACAWSPSGCDVRAWADHIVRAGARYAVLTTRHHDGYCLWDTQQTDYSSARQGPRRDFVGEFVEACRDAGLRVGLYYSLSDMRLPAYFEGPAINPQGWAHCRSIIHAQVRELLTGYGPIDVMWFDGAWPRTAEELDSPALVAAMRQLQPHIMINNRLGWSSATKAANEENVGESRELGDFGTPEHRITADRHRPWESCQVSTWRLWGWAAGERFRSADVMLDMLTDCASQGGNLLLNVGPDPDGAFPQPFIDESRHIGAWLDRHGECIYGSERGGEVMESVTFGRTIVRGDNLYLVFRFWPGVATLQLPGPANRVLDARLLSTDQPIGVEQRDGYVTLSGLPEAAPTPLFPVIRLRCEGRPARGPHFPAGMWSGDPLRFVPWARSRGEGAMVDGTWPPTPGRAG